MAAKNTEVWALAAYSNLAHAKRKNAVPSAICYAVSRDLLPFGGWIRQGYGVEVARRASAGESHVYLQDRANAAAVARFGGRR